MPKSKIRTPTNQTTQGYRNYLIRRNSDGLMYSITKDGFYIASAATIKDAKETIDFLLD